VLLWPQESIAQQLFFSIHAGCMACAIGNFYPGSEIFSRLFGKRFWHTGKNWDTPCVLGYKKQQNIQTEFPRLCWQYFADKPQLYSQHLKLVLLTGSNGLHCSINCGVAAQERPSCPATARSQSKCDAIRKEHPTSALELMIVEDFTKAIRFDKAVKGVDYIIHTASPLRAAATGLEVMLPAVEGNKSILRSASTQPQLLKICQHLLRL